MKNMIFDLGCPSLNFEINGVQHHINAVADAPIINIDGVELHNMNWETEFLNPKFLLSDQIIIVSGTNSEGLNLQYSLTVTHDIGKNGEDIYTVIDFKEVR